MNQEKIGNFILKLRKEKNLTQQQLADKLQISDKTISKWENGRGMPDLSLIKPLCDELGITINDLLSGERVDKSKYQEKLEENILNTIDYTSTKMKKKNKIYRTVIIILLIIFLSISTMFIIDVGKMRQNKPVIFSSWGFKYSPTIDITYEEIQRTTKEYLIELANNDPIHYEGEKTFVSLKIYLIEETKKDKYYVYTWVNEAKYYLDNGIPVQDSNCSIPHKFTVEKINDTYQVTNNEYPRDGSNYKEDMKELFPKEVRKEMDNFYFDGTNERLNNDIEEQIKLYFHQ